MPPHCDSLDGPVVTAARKALDAGDVDVVAPYVHAEGEDEVRAMFEQVLPLHEQGGAAGEIADRLFFETVVRVHRAGENAPYTGLKPAGLDVGPVIPLAERAVERGDSDEVAAFLAHTLDSQLRQRMSALTRLGRARDGSVAKERAYVEAMLGFEVFSHRLYRAMTPAPPADR